MTLDFRNRFTGKGSASGKGQHDTLVHKIACSIADSRKCRVPWLQQSTTHGLSDLDRQWSRETYDTNAASSRWSGYRSNSLFAMRRSRLKERIE